ncbi:hypothetical protein K438DRAFT_1750206 [Mycena galopus ATCC 62051]|nr:hypothetical protein K438DRAFT_1750206 [Mycena galopus ATCC 62051]
MFLITLPVPNQPAFFCAFVIPALGLLLTLLTLVLKRRSRLVSTPTDPEAQKLPAWDGLCKGSALEKASHSIVASTEGILRATEKAEPSTGERFAAKVHVHKRPLPRQKGRQPVSMRMRRSKHTQSNRLPPSSLEHFQKNMKIWGDRWLGGSSSTAGSQHGEIPVNRECIPLIPSPPASMWTPSFLPDDLYPATIYPSYPHLMPSPFPDFMDSHPESHLGPDANMDLGTYPNYAPLSDWIPSLATPARIPQSMDGPAPPFTADVLMPDIQYGGVNQPILVVGDYSASATSSSPIAYDLTHTGHHTLGSGSSLVAYSESPLQYLSSQSPFAPW